MKLIIGAIIAVILTTVSGENIYAHGSKDPKHGGIVQISHELIFELVRGESEATLYIRDHDEPVDAQSYSGTVTVLSKGKKDNIDLMYVEGNKLSAAVAIPDGSKVLIKVKPGDHHSVTVRFSIE